MADLVLYGLPLSPFVRKVEVVLRENDVEYDLESVNIMDMPATATTSSSATDCPSPTSRSAAR
jgi:glutathione S-transferase